MGWAETDVGDGDARLLLLLLPLQLKTPPSLNLICVLRTQETTTKDATKMKGTAIMGALTLPPHNLPPSLHHYLRLSVCLPVCLSVCLSVCMFVFTEFSVPESIENS